MGVGIGGLITQMMQGDPSQQLAQQLAGPHPDPMAQGSPQGGQGAPQGQPQAPALPPAQAYAPDPANASVMSALLKVHQQDMASNSINQNINRIAASFGTAQQQHDAMAAIGAGGDGGDTLGALGQIQRLQSNQMELENKQRFQASAEMLGQTFGLKKGQGGMLSSDPELFNSIIGTKVRDMSPTELQKNIEAYKLQAHAAGIPEDQIQEAVQMAFTQSITPGQTSDEKNMMRDIQLFRADPANKGKPLPPELSSVAGYAAGKADAVKTSVEAGKIRLDNTKALPDIESGLKPIMDNLDRLLANEDYAVKAVQLPDQATSGVTGLLAGKLGAIDPKTLAAKQDITQLKGLLSGDVMKTQKNIRTQREFNSVTSGASPIFDAATPPEKIKQGLKELRDKFNLLRENAKAAAGHEVSPEYADKVDKDYFDKDSPLYNGATKPSGGGRPMPADDLEEARALIAQGADHEKVKAHIRAKGFIIPPGL